MWPTADTVHQSQSPTIDAVLCKMIFDHHTITDSRCLHQKRQGVTGVVQDVDDQTCVE